MVSAHHTADLVARGEKISGGQHDGLTAHPGSARVSRVGDGVPPSRTFLNRARVPWRSTRKDCCGETPQPARETRALPNHHQRATQSICAVHQPGSPIPATVCRVLRSLSAYR
jgi:hypothetical protein